MRGPVPVPPSDLIGRDEELAALAELLVDDGTRLVTLTGPGGSARPGLPSRPRAAWSASFASEHDDGNEDKVRDATRDVCVKIVEETVPAGAARDQAVSACKQGTSQ
jgi:hypothetical protein